MDWITGYIEAHITKELDYDAIARESCSSRFHFQRMFSILCGFPLREDIRNRRQIMSAIPEFR